MPEETHQYVSHLHHFDILKFSGAYILAPFGAVELNSGAFDPEVCYVLTCKTRLRYTGVHQMNCTRTELTGGLGTVPNAPKFSSVQFKLERNPSQIQIVKSFV